MESMGPGSTVSNYRVLSKIGAGGMGEVYLAEDSQLDRKVALKVLLPEFVANEDRLRRFIQEAKAAASLNHPHIAHIYEVGEAHGTRYIAMEFVDGETFTTSIRNDSVSLGVRLKYLSQVAEALAKAHGAGIVHRDLKPDNIMITRDGYAKILDFGLAKLIEPPGSSNTSEDAATAVMPTQPMSAAGTVMGTAGYMSPEQAQAKPVDQRTDIFSFGCILYEAATGKRAFQGDSAIDTLHKIVYSTPAPVTDQNPELPPDLQRIIRRSLAKEPEKRYQTIRDAANDLDDLQREFDLASIRVRSVTPASVTSENDHPSPASSRHNTANSAAQAQPTSSAEYLVSQISSHKRVFAGGLLILLALIAFGYWYSTRGAGSPDVISSLAVMPFVNESGNADVEYLSDGMTETLISSLSQLPNLNVKPRSSVFRYKGKNANSQTIGKELNVQAILNGRVIQRGTELSLFAELIDVALDKVVWSQQYNRKQSDLISLQSEIASDVSNKLKTKLSGADEAKVTNVHTTNPEAYQLYLKGNYYFSKYHEGSYQKAIDFYKQALEIDPKYALPHHGIAAAYNWASDWYVAPKDAEPKAKAAALRALELDDTLAHAHWVLAMIAFWYDYDWLTAEREMKRASELDSSYSIYPPYLSAMGRHDEAIKAQEMRLRQLPFDLNMSFDLEGVYFLAGKYDESINQARKTIELDQNFWGAYWDLGQAYERKKQYPEAIAALEKARGLDNNSSILGHLGYVYAAAGKRAEAQRILSELKEISTQRHVSPYSIAIIYAGLDDKDQAFEWLEKAYEARSFFLTLLGIEPALDNLRPDPRYKDLLRRMNLPQ